MGKTVRKCSVCRTPGHTKRTCGLREQTQSSQKKKILHSKKPIMVKVKANAETSPHFIDLKRKEKKALHSVQVFNEGIEVEPVKMSVNMADLVKKKNQDTAKHWKNKMKQAEKNLATVNKKIYRQPTVKFGSNVWRVLSKEKVKTSKQASAQPIEWTFTWKRVAYGAIALLLVIGLPLPSIGYYQKIKDINGVVVEESTEAFLSLQASTVAALNSDIDVAEQELSEALAAFGKANSLIEKEYQVLLSVAKLIPVVGTHVSSRQDLLVAGHHLALGNTYMVKGIRDLSEDSDAALTDRLSILRRHLKSALPQYEEALDRLGAVDTKALPTEYQQPFDDFTLLFGAFVNDLSDLVNLSEAVNTIFGSDSFRRYLIVFQNNHELRPTGGFMGSFAVMDVQKGKILNIDVPGGGTYDLQGQLGQYVKPPLPLQLVNKRWEFQDSNWFPDFAASAKKMSWFYHNARNTTVDGVIAINASVLERILGILGPLNNEEYGVLLDHENVLDELQYEVEIAYDKDQNKPKAILSSLLDQLINSVHELEPTKLVGMMSELNSALSEKEVQVYMEDGRTHSKIREFGWTGEIVSPNSAQDYLMVVHANVQGQKSDAKIEQEIAHQAVVEESGLITDTVVIRRTHTGVSGEQFYGVPNISFVRVYVPAGAKLIEAKGFTFPPEEAFKVPETWYLEDEDLSIVETSKYLDEKTGTVVTSEFGKTSFGNWVVTAPGETSEISITYQLPFRVPIRKTEIASISPWERWLDPETETETSRYSLVVQKQSGTNSSIDSTIIYPNSWTPVWKSDSDIDLALNGATYSGDLDTDTVIGIVLEKQ